jgi:hypothetical protein
LQQSTGAIIKLPEDSQQTAANEVPVKIIGAFQASQVKFISYFDLWRKKKHLVLFSLLNDVFSRLYK